MTFYSQLPVGDGGPPSLATLLLQLPDEARKSVVGESGDQTDVGCEDPRDLVDPLYHLLFLRRSEVRIMVGRIVTV